MTSVGRSNTTWTAVARISVDRPGPSLVEYKILGFFEMGTAHDQQSIRG